MHNLLTIGDSYLVYDRLYHHSGRLVLSRLAALCKGASALALFVLTFVTSSDNYDIHKTGFVSWLVFGTLALLLFVYTWRSAVPVIATAQERFVWNWFRWVTTAYFGLGALAVFFFYIHNTYCTPYMYSFFGMCEFGVIVCYVLGVGLNSTMACVWHNDAQIYIGPKAFL